jgi:Conjugative transposon protein TcpC
MRRGKLQRGVTGDGAGLSLLAIRAAARTPRIALMVACAVLALVGLSALVSPRPPAATPARSQVPIDLGAQAFAEAFARAYLTWDSNAPDVHERAVAKFLASDVDPAAGMVVPSTGSQRVAWTGIVADRQAGERRRIITIAAETSRGAVHLAVPVSRDARRLLFVSAAPALVGPPAHTTTGAAPPEVEVEDRRLRTLGARVVRNYLAGERDDLAADLHPRAVVSLPELRLKVQSIDAVTWGTEPRRIAVAVTAAAHRQPRVALRYELSVSGAGGRWLVRTVHTNPIAPEEDR